MCSRYYVDMEAVKALQRLAGDADDAYMGDLVRAAEEGTVDVCPSQNAVLVLGQNGRILLKQMRWGYPQHDSETDRRDVYSRESYNTELSERKAQRLLINARAETAAEKPAFRESLHMSKTASFTESTHAVKPAIQESLRPGKPALAGIPVSGRCAVPAAGFYEWNRSKEKAVFTHRESPVFYMAGLYRRFDGEDRFVVLTTQANASVAPVHERMPLILEADELETWLNDDAGAAKLLAKTPGMLTRSQEYEQLSLFGSL